MNILHTKKFRYGSVSMALTIIIIAAVILVNAIVTALVQRFGLYLDMTVEKRFTLSDQAADLLDGMDMTKKVEIILCAPEDVLEANTASLDVLETVRDIAKRYDNVERKHVDVVINPSAVSKYKEQAKVDITSSSVIVASGSECRVFSLSAFFTYDSTGSSVVGYNGEQRLVSAILSVTQDERPLVCITTGHGEVENLNAKPGLMDLLHFDLGYDYQFIDLKKEEIPAECRMVLIFDPESDFLEKNALNDVSELAKLDKFLAEDNALMVFFDYETPQLTNLEDFLAEWGIAIARSGEANYLIKDADKSFTTAGYTNVAEYVTGGLGGSMTSMLWQDVQYPKSVVFPYATAIKSTYEQVQNEDDGSWEGYYYANGLDRSSYSVFTSSASAIAEAGGATVESAKGPFSYMTITRQSTVVGDTTKEAHVLACASTQFATAAALEGGYGNRTALAYACSVMNREVITASIDPKYYADLEINSITAKAANQYTIVFTVIPAAIIFISGIYIMVRRKYR